MALHNLYCADVPLTNCSLTHKYNYKYTYLYSLYSLSLQCHYKHA